MSVKIQGGGSTSGQPNVDSGYNLNVTLPQDAAHAGYAIALSENDPGTSGIGGAPSTRYAQAPKTSEDNRLSVGSVTPIFDDIFNMGAQNTGIWQFAQATTTMAATLGSGFLTMNSGSVLTAQAAASYQTARQFEMRGDGQIEFRFTYEFTAPLVANQVHEVGLFKSSASGATPVAPVDGIWFQMTTSGLIGVVNFNGVATQVGPWTGANVVPTANVNQQLKCIITERTVEFWAQALGGSMNGELAFLGEITTPSGNAIPFLSEALPFCIQSRNSGTVSGTPGLLKISAVAISQGDINLNVPFAHQQTLMGLMGSQGQNGGTMGSTALYSNSLASGAGTVGSNTATIVTGLGGQASIQPTLAVGTDAILCSYQVPVGSTSQTARQLVILGVTIHGAVSTTALTGGPVLFAYSLAYGHTALSMATAESASFTAPSTKAPRRVPLGFETYAATAAVGTLGSTTGVVRTFNAPIVVNPGEYVAVCAKNLGVVTSAGVITTLIEFDAYWV